MSDLVERLRAQGTFRSEITLYEEAADEIERIKAKMDRFRDQHEKDYTEIKRLQKQVQFLQGLEKEGRNAARFRAALEEIKESPTGEADDSYHMVSIASAVLEALKEF